MAYSGPHIVIYSILITFALVLYGSLYLIPSPEESSSADGFESSWVFRLIINLLGYSTVFLPGLLIYKYVKLSKFIERSSGGWLAGLMKQCFGGGEGLEGVGVERSTASTTSRSLRQETLLLLFCFTGLQGTYLTWGILQEKVMTQAYTNSLGDEGFFKDSQFLVFINRILAFLISGMYIMWSPQPKHPMPLYKYAYSSFSNIMSSWCQYEALKFVGFPTQVLAKASKIIPVMIMGKLVSKQKYEYYEYLTAMLISIGMTFFMMSTAPEKEERTTTISGLVLLVSYMTFDSFTANWQGSLFTQYGMSSVQMMCGVNLFSCLFTAVSLLQQGGFASSFEFMAQFPKFSFDCILLSISSGAGQLFIFFTIASFGPVVFVIIMTIRQGLAILLSCILYNHILPPAAVLGVVIVFVAVFLRIYCNQRLKAIRRHLQSNATCKV